MKHLLAVSIGPVQSFIAAGRRTADLYAGSELLKEVVREVARSVPKESEFVFPANAEEVAANKLLVLVDDNPRKLAHDLKHAARKKLFLIWEDVTEVLGKLSDKVNHSRAKEQLGAFLEFYAAWYPLTDGDYRKAAREVELLLAGRKALRDFLPPNQKDKGIPKSSLDPAYAAVIDPEAWGEARVAEGPLRIRASESLDAISLLKRVYGVKKLGSVPSTRVFARRSIDASFSATEFSDDDPEKQPYFAVLVADGDGIGEHISKLASPEEHRKFSERLSRFSSRVEQAVRQHGGYAVYAGGDDSLSFLPLTTAFACAKQIQEAFIEEVGEGLTISIGLTIAHYRQPLSITLEHAREVERWAKKDKFGIMSKNALAVAYYPRAGRPIGMRMRWDDERIFQLWDYILGGYRNNKIPRGLAYDLGRLVDEWDESQLGKKSLIFEARRVLKQKNLEGILPVDNIHDKKDLTMLVNQLRIGRFLAPMGR